MVKNKKTKKVEPLRGLGQKERKFLHLKEFSQGKPNELSLNVLEQKVADLDEPPRRFRFWQKRTKSQTDASPLPSSLPENGSASVNQAESVKKTSRKTKGFKRSVKESKHSSEHSRSNSTFLGMDSQAEIAQRQRRRKRYRQVSIAVVATLCICAAAVGGSWLYQEQVRLSTSVGVLHEACDIIEKSDEVTVTIDTFFQSPFDDNTVSTATSLIDSIPGVREDLSTARGYAEKARNELEGSQRDKEAADHVLATIVSRETMLDFAEQRLNDDIAAKQALDLVEQAQNAINEGNALLAQSAQVIVNTNEETVAQSTEYTTSAKGKFEEAKTLIEQAQGYYSSADFTGLLNYVTKKSEAAGEALASNAAILIQDRATAEAHNDAYNAADAEASTMAESLPSDLTEIVVNAYVSSQEALTQDYEKARSDAATHDAFLREYLGTNR